MTSETCRSHSGKSFSVLAISSSLAFRAHKDSLPRGERQAGDSGPFALLAQQKASPLCARSPARPAPLMAARQGPGGGLWTPPPCPMLSVCPLPALESLLAGSHFPDEPSPAAAVPSFFGGPLAQLPSPPPPPPPLSATDLLGYPQVSKLVLAVALVFYFFGNLVYYRL